MSLILPLTLFKLPLYFSLLIDNSLSLNVTSIDRNVSLSWEIECDVACSLLEEEREGLFLEISGLCLNKEQIIINVSKCIVD